MTDAKRLSRREWFRLGKTQSSLGADDPTGSSNLKPIEHPPNHDGLDLSELPPMREALLSIHEVESLFADIAALGSEVQLMQRTASSARGTAQRVNATQQLTLAKTALVEGTINRLQVRYHWNDRLWIDTLTKRPDGYSLVRIAHGVDAAGA